MIRRSLTASLGTAFCLYLLLALSACSRLPITISGQVVTGEDAVPIPQALVTLRASEFQTQTQDDGSFEFSIPEQAGEFEITAWAPGYYIAYEAISAEQTELTLTLRPYHANDHPDYDWLDPTPGSSESACGNCHPMILPQWETNAHGGAIDNERFFSFYNGTNTSGEPIDAPGYLTDFPGTTGVCATCHAPGAGLDGAFTTDMNAVRGDLTAGIHCDFCHKVGDIYLDPSTYQVYSNVPGALSMQSLRPPEGDQIFIGPYPDIHDPDTFHPIFSESAFCAPCHSFTFWGTEIYNSYGEWLESDYAEQGTTCQVCHMPPSGETIFVLPEQGGLEHPPEAIPSHFQLGVKDVEFMRSAIELDVAHEVTDGKLKLEISLTNATAGHHVPTDHPGRHIILHISALDSDGTPVPMRIGNEIPEWIGDLAGEPGEVYAKVLKNARTGYFPVVDYWNPTLIQSDTRIPANETRTSAYEFDIGENQVTVQIQVLFRRMFQPTAQVYGWDISEILMAEETIEVQP
jgi:hypothetical protein